MIIYKYVEEKIICKKSVRMIKLFFNDIECLITADAKYQNTELRFKKRNGYHRKNINLSTYIFFVKNYLDANTKSNILTFKDTIYSAFLNTNINKITIDELKITNFDLKLLIELFPNIKDFNTNNCTIYPDTDFGLLKGYYMDSGSEIMSLNSFNNFSGYFLSLNKTKIKDKDYNTIHIYSDVISFHKVKINYELFLLRLDAPNLRKLEIFTFPYLVSKDLTFISGFTNLECIDITAIIDSKDIYNRMIKLRKVRHLTTEDYKNYMTNSQLELLNKLYVDNRDSVIWLDKISSADIDKIKKDLSSIKTLKYEDRKKIGKRNKKYNSDDLFADLVFDYDNNDNSDVEKVIDYGSNPFLSNGDFTYYKKKIKIIK